MDIILTPTETADLAKKIKIWNCDPFPKFY